MVLVTCDRITHERLKWSGGPASYLEAVAHVGLLPVQLPTIAEPLDPSPLLDVVSGVVVTGARSNVHPSHYGGDAGDAAAPFDPDRDRTTLPLIRAAIERGLPLLAICRGIQELNVALGGTLYHAVHSLPGRDDHRSTPQDDIDAWFGLKHQVSATPGGLVEEILGSTVTVNSCHHQGIDTPAPRARVEALAPDGTIEAISVIDAPAFALGVQWHPEHFVRSDGPSGQLFEAFAEAVRSRAAVRQARAA